ncbi:Hsp20/alpha crystallin family protein [Legionella fallonii]|uniref:Putative heat shock protein, Hsp20 family n=1 Tax=Legionella fallonii LLAP-10 TaxID=1212491 RepID=A0A098G752_9GAMM|nr:Hsp20/alpha crystallin family protein [Legionella fallonii]CEG57330.1 putative heat shock protein, Hsp20 family [Legionella fallonii LLAP-10]
MNSLRRNYFPIYKDFGSLIDNFLSSQTDDLTFSDSGKWAPAVDIKEEKNQFLVIADLPGVEKENIHISLENNILTLHGSRSEEKRTTQEGYSRVERTLGQFHRQFTLPQTADGNKVSAKYKNGILEITIPKKEQAVEKRIEIKIEE